MAQDGKKILIVDDDVDFTEAISSFLGGRGYAVLRAQNARDGIRTARQERPDLIILDIMMTERTEGFFAAQEIRRIPELASVPIFVLTSIYERVPEFTVAPETSWLPHDEFFTKPVDLEALLGRIRGRIGGGEAGRKGET